MGRFLLLSISIGFALSGAASAGPPPDPVPSSLPSELSYGFEPVRTKPRIVFDSFLAVLTKIFTGKGKGVLEIELPGNLATREKYIALVREYCPNCRIRRVRESHGTLSYEIRFPDRFRFRSSLDAGGLEWQTMPNPLAGVAQAIPRVQAWIYDLSRRAGAWLRLKATGGHVTTSGLGGDSFLYGGYLKFRATLLVFDWGFFGKDAYNAMPVRLWRPEQQARYAEEHARHDRAWEAFLKRLEAAFDAGASDDAIMRIFSERAIVGAGDLGAALAGIYSNPEQESEWTGERSKPKYVANRPTGDPGGMFENRSPVPQRNAVELYEHAALIEAEVRYIRKMGAEGKEAFFAPGVYERVDANFVASQSKTIIEDLGLRWETYRKYSPVQNPVPTGKERRLASFFAPKEYGAAARDRLFERVLEKFFAKSSWSAEERAFVLARVGERGTTVEALDRWTKRLAARAASGAVVFDFRDAAALFAIVTKYPAAAGIVRENLASALAPVIAGLWEAKDWKALSGWAALLPDGETLSAWSARLKGFRASAASLDFRFAILDRMDEFALPIGAEIERWFAEASTATLEAIPSSIVDLSEWTDLPGVGPDGATKAAAWRHLAGEAVGLAAFEEAEGDAILVLAGASPEREAALLAKLREALLRDLARLGYGADARSHYRCVALLEKTLAATPVFEKGALLDRLEPEFRRMHAAKNDPDSAALVERIEKERKMLKRQRCEYVSGSTIFRRVARFLFSGGLE